MKNVLDKKTLLSSLIKTMQEQLTQPEDNSIFSFGEFFASQLQLDQADQLIKQPIDVLNSYATSDELDHSSVLQAIFNLETYIETHSDNPLHQIMIPQVELDDINNPAQLVMKLILAMTDYYFNIAEKTLEYQITMNSPFNKDNVSQLTIILTAISNNDSIDFKNLFE